MSFQYTAHHALTNVPTQVTLFLHDVSLNDIAKHFTYSNVIDIIDIECRCVPRDMSESRETMHCGNVFSWEGYYDSCLFEIIIATFIRNFARLAVESLQIFENLWKHLLCSNRLRRLFLNVAVVEFVRFTAYCLWLCSCRELWTNHRQQICQLINNISFAIRSLRFSLIILKCNSFISENDTGGIKKWELFDHQILFYHCGNSRKLLQDECAIASEVQFSNSKHISFQAEVNTLILHSHLSA